MNDLIERLRTDAAPAVQDEPVAYISQEDFEFLLSDDMSNQYGTRQVPVFSRKGCRASVPLYASPQPPAQDERDWLAPALDALAEWRFDALEGGSEEGRSDG